VERFAAYARETQAGGQEMQTSLDPDLRSVCIGSGRRANRIQYTQAGGQEMQTSLDPDLRSVCIGSGRRANRIQYYG